MKEMTVVIGAILLAWLITFLIPGPLTLEVLVYQIFFTFFALMWQTERYKNRE